MAELDYRHRVLKALNLVGRCGAVDCEFGWRPAFDEEGNELDEATAPASAFPWYATARFKGATITVEGYRGPAEALEGLEERLKKNAICANCKRPICWGGTRRRYCWWKVVAGEWQRGCPSDFNPREADRG